MVAFKFKHVCIEAFGVNLPTQEVTSAEIEDRLSPLYERLQIPHGTLERVSGIRTRRMWDRTVMPSTIATAAATEALSKISFDKKELGMLINCSVARDLFEPATACLIHKNLGLPEQVIAFDVTNACVGMSNGVMLLGNMIESGIVKAGILVSGETSATVVEGSFKALLSNMDKISRDDILKILPTFTIGCGGVAIVMCHESISKEKHYVLGGAASTSSDGVEFCLGSGDFAISTSLDGDSFPIMKTESGKLMAAAATLGGRTWREAAEAIGWSRDDVDHIFCHQVGRQVNEAFYNEMGLDYKKEFTIYRDLGNMISAAMPIALITGVKERNIQPGEKIVCTAYGSGLNSIFFGIRW